jgi:short-subunit dehydrogenase
MASQGTALITGASMGIGLELARVFAAHGHSLVLVARSEDKLRALAAELSAAYHVKVSVVRADLTESGAPQSIADAVAAEGVTVDYLVNNAGFGSTGPFLESASKGELEMVQVNVASVIALTHLFGRGMVERRRGGVMNIASTAGFQPGPNMATYYATKAFVLSFTEAFAEEVRSAGVHATAYCPGPVATDFPKTAGNANSILFKLGAAKPDAVARHAYSSLMSGRVVAIQGVMNWIGVQLLRVSPRALVRKLVSWVNSVA